VIRFVAATRTAVIVIAWLVGAPILLTALAGAPLPDRSPAVEQITAWWQAPLHPAHKAVTVRALAWLIWAVTAAALSAVLAAQVRRLRWSTVTAWLPPPVQSLTAALVGAAAITTTAAAPAALATPVTATASTLDTRPQTAPVPEPARPAVADAPVALSPAAVISTAAITPVSTTVGPAGDPEPGSLDRSRAPSPAKDNATGPEVDVSGILAMPARPAAMSAPSGGTAPTEDPSPTALPGDADVPAGSSDTRGGTCNVVRGDTLWDLADEHLGDPLRWREIYRLNRGHVQANGNALTDPDEIDVGWVLALPPLRPGAQPLDPPVTQPPVTEQPPPASPSTPQAQPSTSASPTASTNSQQETGDSGSAPPPRPPSSTVASPAATVPASTGTPSVPGSAPPATGDDRDHQEPSATALDGVDLPGGWITVGLGGGLLAAIAMVWARRRHHYQPTPITRPGLDDADLLPPLAAMTRIRASLRRTAPETLDKEPASAPTVREYRDAVVKPVMPPVGPSSSDLAGTAALPLSTGLGLTGDGALDAARGLLIAALTSGSDDDPDAKGRAIIPAATLTSLLGGSPVDLGHLDRLTVTASDADAITTLEEEIIRRSRLLAEAQAADVHTWRDTDVHAEPLPQLLLIAETPDPAWTHRLATAVSLGHRVDIGAAIIGNWPTGTTLTVAADGTTGNDDAPRLTVLDLTATIEMLGMLRQAHGDTDSPTVPEPTGRSHTPAPATEPDVVVEPNTGRVDDIPTATTETPATASRLPVAVRVLGRPAVLTPDGKPSPGIRSKAIELLVYLAVNRHGADLSDIMEALFPDATMRRASERLSTVVADLRKHIRQAAAAPTDTEQTRKQRLEPIPNTGSRYHLDPAIVRVDWWTLLDHYEVTATATDDAQRLTHVTAALDAAGGGLAEGVEYDWIDTDREAVRRHRIKLHAHAAALLADTDPHRSWLLLDQACQIDPLCDELARSTMHAAAAVGDADAIRHRLNTLRDALDAHGLDLPDDTQALAHELLHQLRPPPQR
jgi:nucleoid-associated protein YgaU/DNA-binding SARP family transcriptional activator